MLLQERKKTNLKNKKKFRFFNKHYLTYNNKFQNVI